MIDKPTNIIIIIIVTGTIALLMMGLFGATFILFYHRRQREAIQEKRLIENFQRELLQSQLEIQNHTLQQISQDLHDNIGQLLTVVIMRMNVLEDELEQPDAKQAVEQTRALVKTVISDVRALSKTLDADTVQRFGLLPSLTLELERIQRIGPVQTQLVMSGETYSLSEQTEIVLLRMAQESINNSLKHAQPRNLIVSVAYYPDSFSLTIADDGWGFDVDEAMNRSLEQAGAGLNNLQRRCGLLGGTCTISSRIGGGSTIQIQLPRNHAV